MNRNKRIVSFVLSVIFLFTFIFSAVPAVAADRTASPWFERKLIPTREQENMTGDWFGMRDKLKDKGITFMSTYVGDVLGNPTGGMFQGTRYDHSIGMDLNFDMEKLAGLKGTQFHVSGIYRAGRNLSKDVIGNTLTVTSIFGSEQLRFYELYIDQLLWKDRINIRIGRIATGDDFVCSPIYWLYVSNAIDGVPISVPINLPFSVYPTATWGARAKIKITKSFYSMTGVYNGDPQVGRMKAHGLDFTLKLRRGVFLAQELGLALNDEKGDKGMPAHYKVGAYLHTAKFDDLYEDIDGNSYVITGMDRERHRGNYGMYFHADRMLYREGGPESDQGFTSFATVTLAPNSMNQFPLFVMGGMFYKGLFPKRDHDIIEVGFAYGKWSRDLANSQRDARNANATTLDPQRYELMAEFSYRVVVTPWMFIQPDMQYIVHPGGRGDIDDALVVGVRTGFTF